MQVQRLMIQSIGIFGSQQRATRWFREPSIGLESRLPVDLIWTGEGIREVRTLLDRIEHGVYT